MKYKKVYVNYKVELLKKLFFKKANIFNTFFIENAAFLKVVF